MKKPLYLVFICLLFAFSCTEDEDPATACGVADPIENLAWLQEMTENLSEGSLSEYSYIKQATYKGETVFFPGSCCPHCNTALILYDCSGNAIQEDYTIDDLEDEKLIWQPANSTCYF
jgi:hypothetical protein